MRDALALHEAYQRGISNHSGGCSATRRIFRTAADPKALARSFWNTPIYHSPLAFIRTLLELGADPNYRDHSGLPSLIAALSSHRADRYEMCKLLFRFDANIQQRGIDGWTPLHYAAVTDDLKGIELLLAHGADPNARTGIDDCAAPLEEAEHLGRTEPARTLRQLALR